MLTCYQVKALNLNQCYKNKTEKLWLTVPPTLQPQKVHVLIYLLQMTHLKLIAHLLLHPFVVHIR